MTDKTTNPIAELMIEMVNHFIGNDLLAYNRTKQQILTHCRELMAEDYKTKKELLEVRLQYIAERKEVEQLTEERDKYRSVLKDISQTAPGWIRHAQKAREALKPTKEA